MSPRTGLMILQMVAYDSMTASSLSLSNLQFGSGCWLKASVAWLVLPRSVNDVEVKQGKLTEPMYLRCT